jgi:DNA-binding MarR family transcriptional regulator
MVPLTPAVFHILLALFGKERHGYDIMQQVREVSQGAVKMDPGTLYGSLDRMIEAGLVAKSNTRACRTSSRRPARNLRCEIWCLKLSTDSGRIDVTCLTR